MTYSIQYVHWDRNNKNKERFFVFFVSSFSCKLTVTGKKITVRLEKAIFLSVSRESYSPIEAIVDLEGKGVNKTLRVHKSNAAKDT